MVLAPRSVRFPGTNDALQGAVVQARLTWLVGALGAAVERRGPAWSSSGLTSADIARLLDLLRAEYPATEDPGTARPETDTVTEDAALARLQRIFGLSPLDADLLTIAAAADIDARIAAVLGALAGFDTPSRPTLGVALELAGRPAGDGAARARLRSGAPLIRRRLLDVVDTGPFLQRRIAAPDRVVAHLLGDDEPDAEFEAMSLTTPLVGSVVADQLGRGILAGASLCHLVERPGASGVATARAAFASVGIDSVAVDLRRRASGTTAAEAAADASREAGLLGAGLVVTGMDDAAAVPQILSVLADSAVPVICADRLSWRAAWTPVAPLTMAAPTLPRDAREQLWDEAAPDSPPHGASPAREHWADLVNLALTAEEIAVAGRVAQLSAAAADRSLDIADLRDAARLHGGEQLAASALRIVPQVTLDDLILPAATRGSLDELVSWARHREQLLGRGGVGGKGTKGNGILSLFAGSPGTGKTLAAEAVAGELGLELYTVELSSLIDKYIGETEKNLENIIREAETLNVVLFFDEADAIFGSRSAVKDSRDRYANQEISYLLQRMERFDGLAVLATNLRGNIDAAFSRRLHFIVSFVEPAADVRRGLWEAHLTAVPAMDPDDPVELDRLAEHVELAGGGIKNVVMAAAFTATAAGEAIGMRHLRAAAERELGKMGRRVPPQLAR
ncbi:MAG: ATPase family associated with various cellular [Pseudonocardiales bacterium]|nr:ATPase family associated with various cellular [Pseudonocardiales bacterium]